MTELLAESNCKLLLFPEDSIQPAGAKAPLGKSISMDFKAGFDLHDLVIADLVVLAIPLKQIKSISARIAEMMKNKILISLHTSGEEISFPFAEAQFVQSMFPDSDLVAVYRVDGSGETFIAGDDQAAVKLISRFVKAAGFIPVLAESLSSVKTF